MNSFQFRAPEYYHSHKTADWYWAVGIIAISAAVTAVILNNVLLAILIVIGTVTLSMHAARPPRDRDVEINNFGVTVGRYRYSYSAIESFWLEHHEHPRLLLKTNRIALPHVIIPVSGLDEAEKDEIRQFLATKIPEEEQTEPLLEQIMEYFGF